MESKLQHSEDLLKLEKEKLQKERRESSEQVKALRADIKQWQDKLNRLEIQNNWLIVFILFSLSFTLILFSDTKRTCRKKTKRSKTPQRYSRKKSTCGCGNGRGL